MGMTPLERTLIAVLDDAGAVGLDAWLSKARDESTDDDVVMGLVENRQRRCANCPASCPGVRQPSTPAAWLTWC